MNNDSPAKAFLVVLLVAVVCSSLVSAAVVILRPIQLNNQLLDRSRNIIQLTGLLAEGAEPGDEEMLALYKSLDTRIVDIDKGLFDSTVNADTFDKRRAASNPELSVVVPPNMTRRAWGGAAGTRPFTWSGGKTASTGSSCRYAAPRCGQPCTVTWPWRLI